MSAKRSSRMHEVWDAVLQAEARLYLITDGLQMAQEAVGRGERAPLESAERLFHEQRRELRHARRYYRLRYMLPSAVLGWAVLMIFGLVAWLTFRAIGGDYLEWFVVNGDVVALIFGAVAIAIDLDRHPQLISAHPFAVISATIKIVVEIIQSWYAGGDRWMTDRELEGTKASWVQSRYRSRSVDFVISVALGWVAAASMLAWLVFIMPLQYVLTLIVGAPGRAALASRQTLWVIDSPSAGDFGFWKRSDEVEPGYYTRADKATTPSDGAVEISIAKHPVTLTAALLAVTLWVADALLYA